MYKHIFVTGISGSGKSELINKFLGNVVLPDLVKTTKVPIEIMKMTNEEKLNIFDDKEKVYIELILNNEKQIEKHIFDLLKINSPLLSEGKQFFYNLSQLIKKEYFCKDDLVDMEKCNNEEYNSEKCDIKSAIIFQKYLVNTCNVKNNIRKKLDSYNTNFVLEVDKFRKFLHNMDPILINRIKIKCEATSFFEENWKFIEIPGSVYLENENFNTSNYIIDMFNYTVDNKESIIILTGDIGRISKYCELYFLQYIPDSFKQYQGNLKYSEYCKNIVSKSIIVVEKIENFTRSDILHMTDLLYNDDPAIENVNFLLTQDDLISLRWKNIHKIIDDLVSDLLVSSMNEERYWKNITRINHNIPIRYIGTINNDNSILTELHNDIKKIV